MKSANEYFGSRSLIRLVETAKRTTSRIIRRSVLVRLLPMIILAALVPVSTATDYFVRKTGNDFSDGLSAANAFLTITKAESVISAGDTVYVGAGTYVESEIIINVNGSSGSRIAFIGDTTGAFTGDAGTVYVTEDGGDKAGIKVDGGAYITIDGFHFINSNDGLEWSSGDHGIISNCESSNNSSYGLRLHGSIITVTNTYSHNNGNSGFRTCHGSVATISNCESDTNTEHGYEADSLGTAVLSEVYIHDNVLDGVYLKQTSDVTLINALIVDNGNHGFNVPDSSNGTQQLTIWHCTVAGNIGDGIHVGQGATATVTNTIVANNGGDGFSVVSGSTTHTYNLIYNNSGSAFNGTSISTGELTSNPLFFGAGDYQIQNESPARYTATDGSSATSIDLLGVSRPLYGRWDMGCYEATKLFADISSAVGFDVVTTTGDNGSGFYWGDLDNDGDLDAILTGTTARLLLSTTEGTSFFTSSFGGSIRRQGALFDIDNDGDLDFWAGNDNSYYQAALFENNGVASFTNVGDLGFSNPSNNEGVSVVDVNRDGLADLAMFSANNNWLGINEGGSPIVLRGENAAVYGLNDSGDYGNGDYCSSGDVNKDGYLDFFYHWGGGKLFLSDGDGTWTESASGISVVTGTSDKMGSAWADYDNDGDLDLFVGRYDSGSPGYLWQNNSGTFTNVAASAGLDDTSGQRGCCWGDYDNDGDLDLYIVTRSGDNVLYKNNADGTFTAVADDVAATGAGHDAVFIDFDNDGDLDLAVSRQSATAVLLRNSMNDDHYLKVRLVGAGEGGTNKAGAGIRVELYDSAGTNFLGGREVGVARGFGGAEPMWLHFGGVDPDQTYLLRVYFNSATVDTSVVPSAVSTTIAVVTIAQMITITEPAIQGRQLLQWVEVGPDGNP